MKKKKKRKHVLEVDETVGKPMLSYMMKRMQTGCNSFGGKYQGIYTRIYLLTQQVHCLECILKVHFQQ